MQVTSHLSLSMILQLHSEKYETVRLVVLTVVNDVGSCQ